MTVLLIGVAHIPTTTNSMIDYEPFTRQVPLYQKALAFIHRDAEMRSVAREAAAGAQDPVERSLRILAWTNEHVRPQPSELPVVDDHVYHIVVRGYGTYDQAADVFATLAAYEGIPSNLVFVRRPSGAPLYAFAVALLDGGWRVFDVREGRALLDRASGLATVAQLRADPSLTASLPQPREADAPYPELVARLPEDSDVLRPSYQMPLERAWRMIVDVIR